jgi:hypothetical protein
MARRRYGVHDQGDDEESATDKQEPVLQVADVAKPVGDDAGRQHKGSEHGATQVASAADQRR